MTASRPWLRVYPDKVVAVSNPRPDRNSAFNRPTSITQIAGP